MDYLKYNLKQGYKKINTLYELNNHLMTIGLDIYWRIKASNTILELLRKDSNYSKRVVYCDFCVGTGEFFELMLDKLNKMQYGKGSIFVGLDFSYDMIVKVKKRKIYGNYHVFLILADVGFLPFKDNSVDFVSISLGIRNLRNPNDINDSNIFVHRFNEIYRVIRRGGYFFGLETSRPPNKLIRKVSDFLTLYVLTNLAKIVSGDFDTYTYLAKSIIDFLDANQFKSFLMDIGFKNVCYYLFTFGIVSLHVAQK